MNCRLSQHFLSQANARLRAWAGRPMSWLPSRGSVVFTLLVAVALIGADQVIAKQSKGPAALNTSLDTITYQGRLTDSSGSPLTGTYVMAFRLYNSATGGTSLWEEYRTGADSVAVTRGLFAVRLGSLTAIPQSVITNNNSLWLGVTVGTDAEMAPRVQLGSVPYAFQANRAARAYGLSAPDGDPADAAIVDNGGKVGIGTTNPQAKLEIDGQSELLRLWNNDSATVSNGYVALGLGNTNRAGGNMNNWLSLMSYGDGYTGTLGSSLGGDSLPLDRADVIHADGESLIFANYLNKPFYFIQGVGGSGGPGYVPLAITGSGSVGIGTTSPYSILTVKQGAGNVLADGYSVYSSRRWKADIAPIENALAKVQQLRGVTFDWLGSGRRDLGLIAEEVGQVFPEIVDYEANGQDARSVDYSRLVAVLIEAIKEQQATVNTQQQQITTLQQQNQALDARLTALERGAPAGAAASWPSSAAVIVGAVLLSGAIVYRKSR